MYKHRIWLNLKNLFGVIDFDFDCHDFIIKYSGQKIVKIQFDHSERQTLANTFFVARAKKRIECGISRTHKAE